jgi:hypothetical protein
MPASSLLLKRLTTMIALAAILSVVFLAAPLAHAAPAFWMWTQSNTDGFGGANPASNQQTAALAVYRNQLYASTRNNNSGAEVWRYEGGTAWTRLVSGGFGDTNSRGTDCMLVFGGKLYLSVWNDVTGCQIYSYDGSDWSLVNTPGFDGGATNNSGACMISYGGKLYCSVGLTLARVYRYDGGTTWTKVCADGFGDANNIYCRSMAVLDNRLYAGVRNEVSGCEVYRYNGGTGWTRVGSAGFGNTDNEEARSMLVYGGRLYAGTENQTGGCAIYRYGGGTTWTRADPGNMQYDSVRTMIEYQGYLVACTGNNKGTPTGAQVWAFDGDGWGQVNSNGFGNANERAGQSAAIFNNSLYVGTGGWAGSACQVWSTSVKAPNYLWYLAEGSTAWGFGTSINIENPNPVQVTARVTYMDTVAPAGNGILKARDVKLPPASQTVINAMDELEYPMDFSTTVECLERRNIAVDRTMTWSSGLGNTFGAHNSIGVNAPAQSWFLPEGSSAWGFECWTLVQNPNSSDATVTLTYMVEGVGPKPVTHVVPAYSRATFNMADDIGAADASIEVTCDLPVIPERSMYTYWDSPETGQPVRREGHASIGTTEPASQYYLAEGTTAWGFTTYVLVQNPNPAEAKVTLTYMTPDGPAAGGTFTMPAQTRKTVRVNDTLPGTDFSTMVSGDLPVIAERSMFWSAGPSTGMAMHDSIGTPAAHSVWYLPDGFVTADDGGTETYTLVQNPTPADVPIQVSYLTHDGTGNVVFTDIVKADSRKTYRMSDRLSETGAAILVESARPTQPAGSAIIVAPQVIVERSIYYGGRWSGTDTIGGWDNRAQPF